MGNIVLLDDLTINKIAAGEVIERPASVIKEMVENSIDAGANNITVEIKNGGISYIKVTDNGKGIAPDDLEIAFERHATSKIRKAEDIDIVTSMVFRGEALASIAAIANVEMISKTEAQDTGYKIVVEAGNILDKQESKGLFDFRKNETKKIEQYNDQESKIKTNVGLGGPINTADVLEQLRKMQQDLQKQVEENPSIKLNDNYVQMKKQEETINLNSTEITNNENSQKPAETENIEEDINEKFEQIW